VHLLLDGPEMAFRNTVTAAMAGHVVLHPWSERNENKFLARQAGLWNLFAMSDEPTRPSEATLPRERAAVLGDVCEHAGCGKDAGWGFAKPKRPSH